MSISMALKKNRSFQVNPFLINLKCVCQRKWSYVMCFCKAFNVAAHGIFIKELLQYSTKIKEEKYFKAR